MVPSQEMTRQLVLAAALLVVVGDSAFAAAIRVDFAGAVTSVTGTVADPEAALGGSIQVGTRFSGHFTFDDSTAPFYHAAETAFTREVSSYTIPLPEWDFHAELAGFSLDEGSTAAGFGVQTADSELYSPQLYASSVVVFPVDLASDPVNGWVLSDMHVGLIGSAPGLPLHGTALAGIPWNLTELPDATSEWDFSDGGLEQVIVAGSLDQLSFAVMAPEPAGATLLAALAAAALLGYRAARS